MLGGTRLRTALISSRATWQVSDVGSSADNHRSARPSTLYGKIFWGVQRATFVIAPDGLVAHVIPKVTPKTHDDEVLAALAELSAA